MTQYFKDSVWFSGPVKFAVLPTREFQKFVAADTSPSVLNNADWIANNTGAITVVAFDDGANGQQINILGDGFTTIANNAVIKTSTGANKLLAANKVYHLTYINGIWYEDA
jgi:hypothetical protein